MVPSAPLSPSDAAPPNWGSLSSVKRDGWDNASISSSVSWMSASSGSKPPLGTTEPAVGGERAVDALAAAPSLGDGRGVAGCAANGTDAPAAAVRTVSRGGSPPDRKRGMFVELEPAFASSFEGPVSVVGRKVTRCVV